MTITLSGTAQLGTDNILLAARTRSKVEFLVMQSLREKVFPPTSRAAASVPGHEGMFNVLQLKALPLLAADLSDAEVETLTKALEAFEQDEKGPGVSVESGVWVYPLLDSLKEK